jgi:hypothetical protein
MTIPTLKLELTAAELDMAFLLFQTAKQDKHSFDEINALMRKIQDQGRPQLEALAVQQNTAAVVEKLKTKKPRKKLADLNPAPAPVEPALPDLTDLKLD